MQEVRVQSAHSSKQTSGLLFLSPGSRMSFSEPDTSSEHDLEVLAFERELKVVGKSLAHSSPFFLASFNNQRGRLLCQPYNSMNTEVKWEEEFQIK